MKEDEVALDHALFRGVTWVTFRKKLARWRQTQRKMMPQIDHLIPEEQDEVIVFEDDPDDSSDTEEVLGLPSDFSRDERIDFGIDPELGDYELQIRIGMAFDQLELVRRAVQHRAAHLDSKKKNARGHKDHEAAEKVLKRTADLADLLATRYNSNYECINSLRPADYDPSEDDGAGARLRLVDLYKDLTIANLAAARTLGDSQKRGSWIWDVFLTKESAATRTAGAMSNCMCSVTCCSLLYIFTDDNDR